MQIKKRRRKTGTHSKNDDTKKRRGKATKKRTKHFKT